MRDGRINTRLVYARLKQGFINQKRKKVGDHGGGSSAQKHNGIQFLNSFAENSNAEESEKLAKWLLSWTVVLFELLFLYLAGALIKSVTNLLIGEGKEVVYLPILLHGGSVIGCA